MMKFTNKESTWRVLMSLVIIAAGLSSPPVDAAQRNERLPWLGMGISPQVDSAKVRFLQVERVTKGGPADRAGLRPGDMITGASGVSLEIGDDLDFLLFLGERKPGERLGLRVVRSGRPIQVLLTVGVMPDSARVGWQKALDAARQRRIAAERQKQ